MRHIFFLMTSPSWSCTSRSFLLRIRDFLRRLQCRCLDLAIIDILLRAKFSYFYRFAERDLLLGFTRRLCSSFISRHKALSRVLNRLPQPFPVSVFFILRHSFMAALTAIISFFTEANLATVPYFPYHTHYLSGYPHLYDQISRIYYTGP